MLEKYFSVQDMIAIGSAIFIITKFWQRGWKNG